MKFSMHMGLHRKFVEYDVFRKIHFRFGDIVDFCLKNIYPRVFSETAKDNWMKLSGIVDLWLVFRGVAVLIIVVTSGRHRK